jgi:hypothetical protein
VTKQQWADLMRRLAANWPDKEFPAASQALMIQYLQHMPDEAIARAVDQAIATLKWRPTTAELLELAAGLISTGKHLPPADAWEEFAKAARRYGLHGEPTWSTPLIAKVAKSHYAAFCMSEVKDEAIYRAQFMRVYEEYVRRDMEDVRMLPAVREYTEQVRLGAGDEPAEQLEEGAA